MKACAQLVYLSAFHENASNKQSRAGDAWRALPKCGDPTNGTKCQRDLLSSRQLARAHMCVCVRVCVFPCPRDVGRVRGRISGDAHTAAGRKAAPLEHNTTRTSMLVFVALVLRLCSRLNFWYRFLWSEWKSLCALFSSRGKGKARHEQTRFLERRCCATTSERLSFCPTLDQQFLFSCRYHAGPTPDSP
jgi:hypothetical protein